MRRWALPALHESWSNMELPAPLAGWGEWLDACPVFRSNHPSTGRPDRPELVIKHYGKSTCDCETPQGGSEYQEDHQDDADDRDGEVPEIAEAGRRHQALHDEGAR